MQYLTLGLFDGLLANIRLFQGWKNLHACKEFSLAVSTLFCFASFWFWENLLAPLASRSENHNKLRIGISAWTWQLGIGHWELG